jgi:hypothetical protein
VSEGHAGTGGDAGAGGAGGGAGGGAADVGAFLSQLPEPIRGEAYFKDIKSVPDLATKAFHQAKLIGRDPQTMVVIPGAEDAAAWSSVYDRLGRPANPGQYALKAPEKLPEGLTLDTELQQKFTAKVHELGLSQRQAAGLYDWWNTERATAHGASAGNEAKRRDDAARALQTDPRFGGAAYEQNVQLAQTTLAHYGDKLGITKDLVAELDRTGLGDHPNLVKMFAAIGKELAEDGIIGAHAGGQAGALSPDEARQQINAKMADPEFMKRYRNPSRAVRQPAIDEMLALHAALAAGRSGAQAS